MDDKKIWIFKIPHAPMGLNQYYQKPWAHSIKKKWTEKLSALIEESDIPRNNKKIHVLVKYFFSTGVKHDADNYGPKLFMDAFTKAKVIKDDTPKYLQWEIAYRDDDYEQLGFVSEEWEDDNKYLYRCVTCDTLSSDPTKPKCKCANFTFRREVKVKRRRVGYVELEVTILE